MSLARDLQNSGSDIVIEEDLADVFGRNQISSKFASSFTTVIKQSGTTIYPLCEGISLVGGVRSTVGRAFKHTPYFSTIVQLSLLTWVVPTVFVASAITNTLQKRLEGASEEDQIRAAPTQEGVSGVIIAIHEQTSSFDWSNLIRAVANVLPGIDVAVSMRPPPAVVLQGPHEHVSYCSKPSCRQGDLHKMLHWCVHCRGMGASAPRSNGPRQVRSWSKGFWHGR